MLNKAQRKYTTTDKELLSIVETLKEFRTILYWQIIEIHTNHKNLTYQGIQHSQRVLRQRLLPEENGIQIKFILGKQNVAADALSRLLTKSTSIKNRPKENYPINENIECLVDFKILQKEQQKANIMGEEIILGHARLQTITRKGKKKIIIPKKLRSAIIHWYLTNKDWPGMSSKIEEYVKACEMCQKFKIAAQKKYGKIPLKMLLT